MLRAALDQPRPRLAAVAGPPQAGLVGPCIARPDIHDAAVIGVDREVLGPKQGAALRNQLPVLRRPWVHGAHGRAVQPGARLRKLPLFVLHGGDQHEERPVVMELQAADAHVGRGAEPLAGRLPGLAVVGRFKDPMVEHAGVQRAAPGRTFRIEHDRDSRRSRQAAGRRPPGVAEIGAQAHAALAIRAVTAVNDVAVGDVVYVGEGAQILPGVCGSKASS